MKNQRAPFMPLSNDIDDDKLERLARDKGVGSFVPPTETEREGEGTTPPAKTAKPETRKQAEPEGATPRSRMKTINLELPDYVSPLFAMRRKTSPRAGERQSPCSWT